MKTYEHDIEMAFDIGRALALMDYGCDIELIANYIKRPESTIRAWFDIFTKICIGEKISDLIREA